MQRVFLATATFCAMYPMKDRLHIVFADLDGTLLNSNREVSRGDLDCLHELGRHHITRVVATGRSLFSCRQVLDRNFPADYLIFSTGAGILDLRTEELIYSANLEAPDISRITGYLLAHRASFMVHEMVPDNHFFIYSGDTSSDNDFCRRLQIYKHFARRYTSPACLPQQSAQIIAVFDNNLPYFTMVEKGLHDYQVTRTTSPLDGRSLWMEILPAHVSKGKSGDWLCRHLGIDPTFSFSIGNDFNDISLLDFTGCSYVVANAPRELREKYRTTTSNDNDGFSNAIRALSP